MKIRSSCLCVAAFGVIACSVAPVRAAGVALVTPVSSGSSSLAESAAAQPFVNPLPAPDTSKLRALPASGRYEPGVRIPGFVSSTGTRAFGTFGIPYTSGRVQTFPVLNVAGNAPNYLSTTYPYSAIGKLTFTVPGGSAFCSASLIRRSVMVTAAHCVQNFGQATQFSNWKFQPGHYGAAGATTAQKAPFGTWTTKLVARADSWANGTDPGTGSARENDLAVFIIAKRAGKFLGDTVGWLAYGWNNYSFVSSPKTGNLLVGAISTLGYPGLMDSGRIMQRADGPTYTTTISGAPQLWQGNNFTGGSSGGPWIVNFRAVDPVLSGGAVQGSSPNMAVVGVTSWGSADPNAPKDNYSSQFGQNSLYPDADYGGYGAGNIGALVNELCGSDAGSGQTYAQQGYCD